MFNFNNVQSPVTTTGANLINTTITLLLSFGTTIALIYLLWGGIRYITSSGDPKATKAAQQHITAAIIGLVITLLSFAIINIVETFFDVQLLNIPF